MLPAVSGRDCTAVDFLTQKHRGTKTRSLHWKCNLIKGQDESYAFT